MLLVQVKCLFFSLGFTFSVLVSEWRRTAMCSLDVNLYKNVVVSVDKFNPPVCPQSKSFVIKYKYVVFRVSFSCYPTSK